MKPASRCWTSLLALAATLAAPPAWAVDEQELKAAIVFNLLLFVEWPADAAPSSGGGLVLCVAASNSLAAPLKALQGREVRNRNLEVRELAPGATRASCHAVYLDQADALRPTSVAQNAPTLVICDDLEVAPPAAAIVLRRVGGRMGFDVNLEAARQARLQFSSKLMRLARQVVER